jgi:hypothetical protein
MHLLLNSPKGEEKMSVHPTTLARHISATWLRNAFSGLLAAFVLVFLLILLP